MQTGLPTWLAVLLQVGGWIGGAITVAIGVRNYLIKRREAHAAQVTKTAGLELLGWSLKDRLELERRLTAIEEAQAAQDEVHDLLEKLMANVLRSTGTKDGQ